jgi:hypothetical protein
VSWRSFLDSCSSNQFLLAFCGGAVLVCIGATLLARRFVPNLAERKYEKSVGTVRDLFALLYFLVLAFGITEIAGTFGAAEQHNLAEASALATIVRDADALPPGARDSIKAAVGDYVHSVVDDEFRAMREGEASPRTATALEDLFGAAQRFDPKPGTELVFYEEIARQLNGLNEQRRLRLDDAGGATLPNLLGEFNLIGAFIFLVLAFPASISNRRKQLLIVAVLAAIVAFAFALTILLDYPYNGQITVSTDPYRTAALAQFFSGK